MLRAMLRGLAFCLLFTLLFSCAGVDPSHRPRVSPIAAKAAPAAALGDAVFAETNRVRKEFGRGIFFPKIALTEAAADQASYMAMAQRASHSSAIAGERDAAERVQRHGYSPPTVAENVLSFKLEADENPSVAALAARVVALWMNSPGHRANLLRRDLNQLGCAVSLVHVPGGEAVFAVQVFAP